MVGANYDPATTKKEVVVRMTGNGPKQRVKHLVAHEPTFKLRKARQDYALSPRFPIAFEQRPPPGLSP